MDPIEQTLVATQNLLCALEQDNSLLKDQRFMSKITYLRSKHKETTEQLFKQTKFPPRDQLAGATYHKSPGCNHYWTDLPQLTYKSPAHEWCRVDVPTAHQASEYIGRADLRVREPSHPAPSSNAAPVGGRPVVQDAADVLRNLRGYRRELRHQREQIESERRQQTRVEDTNSYKPRPHSFRPPRQRASSAITKPSTSVEREPEVVEEDDIPSRSRTSSNSEIQRKNSVAKATPKVNLVKQKARSVQDLRPPPKEKPRDAPSRPPSSQVTVPKPFTFMQRKYKGNTFARKFLEKMLDDKEKEERERLHSEENSYKPFKAVPVPLTTYKSDNPQVESQKYADAIRKKLRSNLKLQTTLSRSKSMGDVTFMQVKPVPASTYVAPDLHSYRRGRDSSKRAVQLLAEAQTPPGLKEHSVRTNVAFHLRHQQCRNNSNEKPIRRQSVPDFRRLHHQFNEKLQKVFSSKPPTVPVPFNLSENSKRHKQCISTSPPRTQSRRPSPSLEPVFPVHETHSSLLRTEAIRKRIDKEITEKERRHHAGIEHEEEVELQRSKIRRSMSRGREKDIERKVEERRKTMMETTRDYEEQLRDIRRRVMSRPLVMEQQSTSAQKTAIERKFKQALSGVSGVSRSMVDLSKDQETNKLSVPLGRRVSGASGGTYSVKSKHSSSSEKEEYKLDFESTGSTGSSSTSDKSSHSSSQSRRSGSKSSSSS